MDTYVKGVNNKWGIIFLYRKWKKVFEENSSNCWDEQGKYIMCPEASQIQMARVAQTPELRILKKKVR